MNVLRPDDAYFESRQPPTNDHAPAAAETIEPVGRSGPRDPARLRRRSAAEPTASKSRVSQCSLAQPGRLRAGPHDPRLPRARAPLEAAQPARRGPGSGSDLETGHNYSQILAGSRRRVLCRAARLTAACGCPQSAPRPRSPGNAAPADLRLSGRAKCDLFPAFAYPQKGSPDYIRKSPLTWEPLTESNRRPSPYHRPPAGP
jgi:hypothetical protein